MAESGDTYSNEGDSCAPEGMGDEPDLLERAQKVLLPADCPGQLVAHLRGGLQDGRQARHHPPGQLPGRIKILKLFYAFPYVGSPRGDLLVSVFARSHLSHNDTSAYREATCYPYI